MILHSFRSQLDPMYSPAVSLRHTSLAAQLWKLLIVRHYRSSGAGRRGGRILIMILKLTCSFKEGLLINYNLTWQIKLSFQTVPHVHVFFWVCAKKQISSDQLRDPASEPSGIKSQRRRFQQGGAQGFGGEGSSGGREGSTPEGLHGRNM